jgi:hypothetical protein
VRRRATAVLALSLLLLAACGDDDENGAGKAETTEPTATSDAGAGSSGPVDKGELESCLAKADLELKPGEEAYTDRRGQRRTRRGLEIEKAKYVGYVMWPSDRIADVYLAEDERAATTAQSEAGNFVRAFGLDPARYVQNHGNLVLIFDRPVPTENEVRQVSDCA